MITIQVKDDLTGEFVSHAHVGFYLLQALHHILLYFMETDHQFQGACLYINANDKMVLDIKCDLSDETFQDAYLNLPDEFHRNIEIIQTK